MIIGAAETLGFLDGEFLALFLEVLDVGHHTQQQVKNQRLHQHVAGKLEVNHGSTGRSQHERESPKDPHLSKVWLEPFQPLA